MDRRLPTPSVEQLSTCELTVPYKKALNIKYKLGIACLACKMRSQLI